MCRVWARNDRRGLWRVLHKTLAKGWAANVHGETPWASSREAISVLKMEWRLQRWHSTEQQRIVVPSRIEMLLTSQERSWTPVGPFLRSKARDLEQGSANYGPWTDHVFVNKLLLKHSHAYWLTYVMITFMLQRQSWIVATDTLQLTTLKCLSSGLLRKFFQHCTGWRTTLDCPNKA